MKFRFKEAAFEYDSEKDKCTVWRNGVPEYHDNPIIGLNVFCAILSGWLHSQLKTEITKNGRSRWTGKKITGGRNG